MNSRRGRVLDLFFSFFFDSDIFNCTRVTSIPKFLEIISSRKKRWKHYPPEDRILCTNRDAGFNQCGSHYQISMLPLCLSSRSFSAVIASRRDEIRFPLLPKPART